MFDFLNGLGLPLKYAILMSAGLLFGTLLVQLSGLASSQPDYLATAIAGAIGGAIGGYIRKRRGKTNSYLEAGISSMESRRSIMSPSSVSGHPITMSWKTSSATCRASPSVRPRCLQGDDA